MVYLRCLFTLLLAEITKNSKMIYLGFVLIETVILFLLAFAFKIPIYFLYKI